MITIALHCRVTWRLQESTAVAVAVSEEESIMYYRDGSNHSTYNDNDFIPVFTDDVNNWDWETEDLRTSAYEECGNDVSCLYDVFVTGDLSIGLSTKSTATQNAEANSALSKL